MKYKTVLLRVKSRPHFSHREYSFFKSHAFQPLLKLVASSGQETRPEPTVRSAKITIEKLFDSDKVKYQRALVVKRLARNPDDVMLDIKYHFVWNLINRKSVFAEPAPMVDFISNTFTTCSEAAGGFTRLPWLAQTTFIYAWRQMGRYPRTRWLKN